MEEEFDLYQLQLRNALNNFGYRMFAFLPYTRVLTNIADVLELSPDVKQSSLLDLTDGSGLVVSAADHKTKVKPNGPGTLHKRIAQSKANVWKKALRPLRIIDITGDAGQLYKDYKILDNAAKNTNGVYKSNITINPYEYH